jgi:flagellar hook-associated protein 2
MSSPITFSGFNSIDFSAVLTAVMAQESQPLTALQDQQAALKTRLTNFATLATKTSDLSTAAAALSTASSLTAFSATSSVPTALSVSAAGATTAGHYDIIVNELARAQVTASASSSPDAATTSVASAGALTINGKAVTVTGSTTLAALASAINANADLAATASVVQDAATSFRLVLTAKATGQANGFTVTNTLSGGSGVQFKDTDGNGVSGNSAADNAVQALDASLLVNNIAVTSASNSLDSVIPGASVTLFKKDPTATIGIDVVADSSLLKAKLNTFALAYNGLVKFVSDQTTAGSDAGSIGRDPAVRQLHNSLRSALSSSYGAGAINNLSQIGVEFQSYTGTLNVNEAKFATALQGGSAGVSGLFAGGGEVPGVFSIIKGMLDGYTQSSGIIPSVQNRLKEQAASMSIQVTRMQDRLAIRRTALQSEFTAADAAMTQLKNQSGSLASFGVSSTA